MRDIDKLFLAFLVMVAVVTWLGSVLDRDDRSQCGGISLNGPANISAGNGTAFFMTGTFEWNQSFMKDLEYNRSFHIPENATENWTIWKGDEMVCYIPRS